MKIWIFLFLFIACSSNAFGQVYVLEVETKTGRLLSSYGASSTSDVMSEEGRTKVTVDKATYDAANNAYQSNNDTDFRATAASATQIVFTKKSIEERVSELEAKVKVLEGG